MPLGGGDTDGRRYVLQRVYSAPPPYCLLLAQKVVNNRGRGIMVLVVKDSLKVQLFSFVSHPNFFLKKVPVQTQMLVIAV